MTFEVVVYTTDPLDLWQQKQKVQVTFRTCTRWLWLARLHARTNLGNTGNCSYLIRDADTLALVESYDAPTPRGELLDLKAAA